MIYVVLPLYLDTSDTYLLDPKCFTSIWYLVSLCETCGRTIFLDEH